MARLSAGIQAQDPRAGRLGFRARSMRLRAADVDRARTEERSIVRTWAMRSTMHLLAAEDAGWLLPLFDAGLVADSRRRLGQLGLDASVQNKALEAIRTALESDGFLGRSELVARLGRLGIEIDAPKRVHLFRLATGVGIGILGPDSGSETLLALARDWVGERPRHDRDAAVGELTRRYVRAFGPATEADFAGWSGLPLRDVRAGLTRIGNELVAVRVGDHRAWVVVRGARRPRGRIIRLLPAWDNYLMGHRDRDFIAGPERWPRIVPGGGLIRPTILVDGAATGTWSMRRKGKTPKVELSPFEPLDEEATAAIKAEIADIERFEGT
ncbi:MAG TPA: winged helix DNA-binding domain-containing protein [Solirubrobacterales bacterium]|nr:winged helix DNA-binding domain-containing protein [Solirubrobacterales bacterium]